MAEKQKSDEEINPFSFKNFIKEDLTSSVNVTKQKHDSQNPFSYSSFYSSDQRPLKSDEDIQDDVRTGTVTAVDDDSTTQGLFTKFSLPDLSLDNETETINSNDVQFGLVTNHFDDIKISEEENTNKLELSSDKSSHIHTDSEDDFEDAVVSEGESLTNAIDELSDDHISLLGTPSVKKKILIINDEKTEYVAPKSSESDSIQGYQQLHERNTILVKELAKAKKNIKEGNERVQMLQAELSALQKKEREETAALEDIIQHVEANLKLSTERAITAEKTAEILKQEVTQLQLKVEKLTAENQRLHRMNNCDKEASIQYVSSQLKSAATTAEQSLKQLLDGVGNLKMLSDVLLSVDKFSEISGEENAGAAGGT